MKWANFLHIYQPPTQKPVWVKRIADESYRKVFSGLKKIPRARIILNINSVLCELLVENGAQDVVDDIKFLIERGNIELTGSAKYHAFLPLLPESEIERQIKLNEEGLTKYFGTSWKKGGFFSPEMAYSKKVAQVAQRLGYTWIVIDELAFPKGRHPERTKVYEIEGLKDFKVFFRERNFSFKILSASQLSTLPAILRFLEPRFGKDEYTVTGMDGETFGHASSSMTIHV
jgi:alpha-amylase/alpha-mannosidase (GH57 family)